MKNSFDLVILAGGKGTRLGQLTKNIPKPLIKINKISFLQYLINYYSKYDFDNIYILAGHNGHKIKKKFYNQKANLIPIHCYIEKKRRDTGGALNVLRNKIRENFILINGDSFFDFDINLIKKLKLKKEEVGSMILTKNVNYQKNKKLSSLAIDKSGYIINKIDSKLMNSGVYYFNKKIFKYIKQKTVSLEEKILPQLIKNKKIKGVSAKGYFIDIGTKKNLLLAKKNFKKIFYKPGIFLDRDGVINKDFGHVYKIENFEYTKSICLSLKKLSNYYIFIITNQAGIAKGLYKEKDFFNLHKKIKKYFLKKNIYINDVKFCPHHPKGIVKKFKKKCLCRKPGNQMIKEILKSWNINIKKSLMIGDKNSDKICANKSGISFQYVQKDINYQINKFVDNQ